MDKIKLHLQTNFVKIQFHLEIQYIMEVKGVVNAVLCKMIY